LFFTQYSLLNPLKSLFQIVIASIRSRCRIAHERESDRFEVHHNVNACEQTSYWGKSSNVECLLVLEIRPWIWVRQSFSADLIFALIVDCCTDHYSTISGHPLMGYGDGLSMIQ
jgi:hypothetical protein